MDEDGLGKQGFYVLGVLFLFFGIGGIFSTPAINRFGKKKCLVAGGIGTLLYVISMTLVAI